MHIEQLGWEQVEAIYQFDRLCFPTDYWPESDWKMLLEDDRAIYYALVNQQEIIGNVFIYNWQGEKDYVKIMNLAVHPHHRNQGLAHHLLNHVSHEMQALGMLCFRGETRQSNSSMRNVFESCGYQLSSVEANYYEDPIENACKYVLSL